MSGVDPKACPARSPQEDRPAFDFHRLSEFGVLWLINRVVFHPRGFALSLEYAEGAEEPLGWAIHGLGAEVWRFAEDFDEDEKLREVEALLDQTRRFGKAPHLFPEPDAPGAPS